MLKRFRFGKRSEQMTAEQRALFDESMLTDTAAVEAELDELSSISETPTTETEKKKPAARRAALPEHLPRREIRHEPDSNNCGCGCALRRIGEDISEKLDYQPGQITVDRHIRGKWVCDECESFTQAPMPAHIIDKCIATPSFQAHVIVSKYADHLPLYRQGLPLGRYRVRSLMQQNGIRPVWKRKFVHTTDSKHDLPVAENILNRQFEPAQPNTVWVSDITYIRTRSGWLYLAAVLDLYSRKIVGWAMAPNMAAELVCAAGGFNRSSQR